MVDWFGLKKTRRRRAMWTQIASDLGGEFHLAKGFWRPTNERIEARVEDVPIVVDTYIVSSGKTSTQYTRAEAPYARGPGPAMKIYREGVLATVGKALGMDDVELGSPAFDREFMVRTPAPAIARRLWTAPLLDLMLPTFRDATLTSEPDRVRLVTTGTWDDERLVRDAITIISRLAARDIYGIEALRTVPGAQLVTVPEGAPHVVVDAGARVVLAAEAAAGVLVTVARTTEPLAHDPLVLDVVDGTPTESSLAATLPQAAHVAVRAAGTGTLTIEGGTARFAWRAIEEDPARLHAGAALLAAIAVGDAAGVYR